MCNQTLYEKSVLLLHKQKYPCQDCFAIQPSFDSKEYICKTCHSKLIKGQQPSQAVINNLFVDETPVELAVLEKLEQIVFEKIVIMPKGQQRKIEGAICNVPVECSQTCNVLPRPPDRSGIILLKLKSNSMLDSCITVGNLPLIQSISSLHSSLWNKKNIR